MILSLTLSQKLFFFKSILIALFELSNLFKSVARKTFFCDVFCGVLNQCFDVLRKFFLSPCHTRGSLLKPLRSAQSFYGDPIFHAPPLFAPTTKPQQRTNTITQITIEGLAGESKFEVPAQSEFQ